MAPAMSVVQRQAAAGVLVVGASVTLLAAPLSRAFASGSGQQPLLQRAALLQAREPPGAALTASFAREGAGAGSAAAAPCALALLAGVVGAKHQASARRSKAASRQQAARVVLQAVGQNEDKQLAQQAFDRGLMAAGIVAAIAAAAVVAADPAAAAEAMVAAATEAVSTAGAGMAAAGGDVGSEAAYGVAAATEQVADAASGDFFEPVVQANAGLIAGLDEFFTEKLGGAGGTFGFAIIGYTFVVKALTFPLNQSSLRTNAMMQIVGPKVKQIQAKYKNDQETQNRMMLRLYDDCGINPLGGCLPSILQLPIFISLYRAINKLAASNPHFTEPFLWIPSLAGPIKMGESNMDWLIKSKYADHYEPMVGWETAARYLVLPVLLVVSQFVTMKISAPTQASAAGPLGAVSNFFPLIIGYSAMVTPAGLALYWLCNNLFTTAQTQLIRNELGNEFPEYAKMIAGAAEKPQFTKTGAKVDDDEDTQVMTRGFGVSKKADAKVEVIDTEATSESAKVPAYGAGAPTSAKQATQVPKRKRR